MKEDLINWQRLGRGKSFEFYMLREEVFEVLRGALPKEFSPYTIIGTTPKLVNGVHLQEAIEVDVKDLYKLHSESMWQFFVRSKPLTDFVNLQPRENLDGYFGVHGFILLQQGLAMKGRYAASRLALMNKVEHKQTGEVIDHSDYFKIYTVLVKKLRNLLVHKVTTQLSDGTEQLSERPLMSDKFAAKVVSGEIQAWAVPNDTG